MALPLDQQVVIWHCAVWKALSPAAIRRVGAAWSAAGRRTHQADCPGVAAATVTVSSWSGCPRMPVNNRNKIVNVADPGCLSRNRDPNFFHPAFRFRIISIPVPDPNCFHSGSRIRILSIPHPGSVSKVFQYLTQKNCF
jgi:hypothetical protein